MSTWPRASSAQPLGRPDSSARTSKSKASPFHVTSVEPLSTNDLSCSIMEQTSARDICADGLPAYHAKSRAQLHLRLQQLRTRYREDDAPAGRRLVVAEPLPSQDRTP